MVQDNQDLLDNSYIEFAIFGLFKIDLVNYIKVKSILAKEFHIQPSEIDRMPAWEYELFMKELNAAVKEENEKQQEEMDKAGYGKMSKMSDPKYIESQNRKMMNNSNSLGSNYTSNSSFKMPSMPSMPNLGSFKMPSMPKI